MGYEPKLLGAVFNPANKGKIVSEPLDGVNGVYVVKVEDLVTTSLAAANIEEQKKQMRDRTKQMSMYLSPPIQVLKKIAKIKDNRNNFY